MKHLILLLALSCICPFHGEAQVTQPATFNVSDFGAKGDGEGNDTPAFRTPSEACLDAGGGVILLPRGVFITGSFELPSQTELQLTSGVIIRGSENLKDYDLGGHQRGLISAFEARCLLDPARQALRDPLPLHRHRRRTRCQALRRLLELTGPSRRGQRDEVSRGYSHSS